MSEQYDLIPSDALTSQFEQMPEDVQQKWLEVQQQKMLQRQIAQLKQQNELMNREIQRQRAVAQERHEDLEAKIKKAENAGAARNRASDKYYVRGVIGTKFTPAISAPRMTKLMLVVGILTKWNTPKAEFQGGNEPLARLIPGSEFGTWEFHCDKVRARVDWWLEKEGYYHDFHNTATKNTRDKFIDFLLEEYTD